ncbi:MAG: LysE family transporter [Candidatus Bathyarchaeia archaeon]
MLNILVFLASVIVISLSGVMMPGPVTAVTIAKGRRDGNAGALVAVGHGVLEFPLMVLIYLGFSHLFTYDIVRRGIGFAGGLMLGIMGLQMFRVRDDVKFGGGDVKFSSVVSGVAATGANPYFFLWWATIGSALVATSNIFGLGGFILFALTHWLCDFFWYLLISRAVFKSRSLWSLKVQRIIFSVCAFILIFFAGWFLYSAMF